MTNSECVKIITSQVYYNTGDCKLTISKECYRKIVKALEENDKLKDEIKRLEAVNEKLLDKIYNN